MNLKLKLASSLVLGVLFFSNLHWLPLNPVKAVTVDSQVNAVEMTIMR